MVLHWSVNDSKTPQVSGTLIIILANLNNTVVCMSTLLRVQNPPVPLLILLWMHQVHKL